MGAEACGQGDDEADQQGSEAVTEGEEGWEGWEGEGNW